MAGAEDKSSSYEKVWDRVKTYIPFLQELITEYKNDMQQNRQQQLQKITTMYDLLTNQRLNHGSLLKCETVLIKLYESNSSKKKGTEKSVPEINTSPTAIVESDTPASPSEPDDSEPDLKRETSHAVSENAIEQSNKSVIDENTSSSGALSKPPLSLEEVTRLISDKPQTNIVRSDQEKKLSKSMNDALKILAKDFQKSAAEQARAKSRYNDSQNSTTYSNPPYSPTYPPSRSALIETSSRPSTFMTSVWESENDSYGSFPHSVNTAFRNVPGQNYSHVETSLRPKSPPLYRRRDDLPIEDRRLLSDRMDVSPMYSSPSDGISQSISSNIKDPRLRKAVIHSFGVHSPSAEQFGSDQIQPLFPTVKNNDPRLNRNNYNSAASVPTPNQLPKCIAPNPDLPLEHGKKDPPKRRLSICANQVIIEELPLQPVLPSTSFPTRRPSVCSDFIQKGYNEPFHGMSFSAPPISHQPIPPLLPSLNAIPLLSAHSIEAPSVAERDPRRKHLPPGAEYIKTHSTKQFDRSIAGPSKAPLTYLEYRRQKEMREKQAMLGRQQVNNSENADDKVKNKTDEEIDATIGMIPNKNRVAAKAYAKPVKASTWKERSPYHPKDAKQPFVKQHNSRTQKHYPTNKFDKKHSGERERKEAVSIPKTKDLFGEQLSQFDKMYRSGDFSKKTPPSGIGVFKIPKIKRIETSASNEGSEEKGSATGSENAASHKDNEKTQCKSSEPLNSNDDDMWDADDSINSPVPTEKEKKTLMNDEPANKPEQALKTLEDDDLWDTEPDSRNFQTSSSVKEFEEPIEKEKEFLVPELPIPHKALRRKNSKTLNEQLDQSPTSIRTSSPVTTNRVMTRRSSIAVSLERADSGKEDLSYEPDEDTIQPRQRKKRKAIIDDDDDNNESSNLEPTALSSTEPAQEKLSKSPLTLITQESGDNLVSSTTNEAKSSEKTTKRTRKSKKSADIVNESNDQGENAGTSTEATSSDETSDFKTDEGTKVVDDSKPSVSLDAESENTKSEEDILKSSSNSNNKAQLLAILSQMCDEKKMKKIQEIIESSNDKLITKDDTSGSDLSVERIESSKEQSTSTSISSSNESNEKEKSIVRRKTKSELDKLNADIAEMYIRDGVLNATGRRSCTKKYEPAFAPDMISTPKVRRKRNVRKKKVDNSTKSDRVEVEPKLKNLRVLLVKMDIKKIEEVNGKQSIITNMNMNIQSIASSDVSPKSKLTKRSLIADDPIPSKKKKVDFPVTHTTASPSKVYTPKPVMKNINRDMYCKSDKSKDCALCSYTGPLSSIVQHYVRNHPLHEVYVSRITSAVAIKIKKDPMVITGVMHEQNITFQCIFCQEVLSKKKYNWKLHLASHTGEYRYKCNNCTIQSLTPCTNAHDSDCSGPAMEVANELFFEENHIYGYMCRVCNYVQLSSSNMENHLREEHERQFTNKGNLRFSILNYDTQEESETAASQEAIDSDISMPELTPQTTQNPSDMSAFIPSENDEIESR